jgi:CHAT domain-containing protein
MTSTSIRRLQYSMFFSITKVLITILRSTNATITDIDNGGEQTREIGNHVIRSAPLVDELAKPLKQLHDWLIKPIKKFLPDNPDTLVVISAHGMVSRVPFAALLDDNNVSLIDYHTLSIAPSFELLQHISGTSYIESKPKMLLFAPKYSEQINRLSYSEKETADIQSTFGQQYQIETVCSLRQHANDLLQLQKSLKACNIFHFTGHTSSASPFGTFLLTDGERDYSMMSSVLFEGLNANNLRLCVLNSCSSGTGGKRESDYVTSPLSYGIAANAILGGAQSVVGSLWPLRDAPASLMHMLYETLGSSIDKKASALRTVMLLIKQSKLFNNPLYWASFYYIGLD